MHTEFEKPMIAVDLLVFTIVDDRLKIVLVERAEEPFKGRLSLPGVFVRHNETLDDAAQRGIAEEAELDEIYFEQLYTWGRLDRDPRERIISVSYLSLVDCTRIRLGSGQRVSSAALYDVEELLSSDTPLAFDHHAIIAYGRERIKNKTEYTRIAFELLPEEFTLPQLQRVYEILLGKQLYKANFRRKIAPLIEDTQKMTTGDAHRPSRYYRQKPDTE